MFGDIGYTFWWQNSLLERRGVYALEGVFPNVREDGVYGVCDARGC
jgi:hypothetical protein